ncbi:MAG: sugar transferase [Candidatus Margulisiibacteriota bacterium]
MFTAIRLVLDAFSLALAYFAAYHFRFGDFYFSGFLSFPLRQYAQYLFWLIILNAAVFYFLGMYRTRRGIFVELDELVSGVVAVSLSYLLVMVPTLLHREYEHSRALILISWAFALVLILISRQIVLRLEVWARGRGFGARRCVIIGSGDLARSLEAKIKEHPSYGIHFVGFVGEPGDKVLGGLNRLDKIIDEHRIQSVFVSDPSISRDTLTELADLCDQKEVSLGSLPDIFQILTTSPAVEDIEGFPMVGFKRVKLTPFNRMVKRTFDVFAALAGLAVFGIPMLLIAALIKVTSPGGPAIYVQKRVGLKGKIFRLYKFRTMVPNAEKLSGPVLATENDPRKTPFGAFLRSTNLDELPQLFNILKGDMSFVGPRPERPIFVSKFKEMVPKYMERHRIKPAIAGWAQLQSGGYDMPPEEKIKYDLYYIENWSLMLDIKIVLKCAQIAFTRRRAN